MTDKEKFLLENGWCKIYYLNTWCPVNKPNVAIAGGFTLEEAYKKQGDK